MKKGKRLKLWQRAPKGKEWKELRVGFNQLPLELESSILITNL